MARGAWRARREHALGFFLPSADTSLPLFCEGAGLLDRLAQDVPGRNDVYHTADVELAGASKLCRDGFADTRQVQSPAGLGQRVRVVSEDIDQRGTDTRTPAQSENNRRSLNTISARQGVCQRARAREEEAPVYIEDDDRVAFQPCRWRLFSDPPIAERRPLATFATPCAMRSREVFTGLSSGFSTLWLTPAPCTPTTTAMANAAMINSGVRSANSGNPGMGIPRGIGLTSATR